MNYLIINSIDYNYEISIHLNNGSIFILKQSDLNFPIKDDIVNLLNELLKKYKLNINIIDVVGVIVGPGSYTSLRIGVALANSLGLALNISVIGVNLFSIILESTIKRVCNFEKVKMPILSIVPDNKGGFFGQLFNNKLNALTDPMVIDQEILNIYEYYTIVTNNIELVKKLLNFAKKTIIYACDINAQNIKYTIEKKYNRSILNDCKPLDVLYIKAPKITMCKD